MEIVNFSVTIGWQITQLEIDILFNSVDYSSINLIGVYSESRPSNCQWKINSLV